MATAEMFQTPDDADDMGQLGQVGNDDGYGGGGGEDEIQVCLPVDNIKEDGIEPQEGDEVEVNVSGTVTKVEGGIAWIKPEKVNGEPVRAGSQGQQGPEHQTNDEDELEKQAMPMLAQRDKELGGGY